MISNIQAYQENISYNGPVKVERNLAYKDEGKGQEEVYVAREQGQAQKEGRQGQSHATDQRISSGLFRSPFDAHYAAQRDSNDAREHRDDTKGKPDAFGIHGSFGFRYIDGLNSVFQEFGTPPSQSTGAKGDTSKAKCGEYERFVEE